MVRVILKIVATVRKIVVVMVAFTALVTVMAKVMVEVWIGLGLAGTSSTMVLCQAS